MRPDSPYYRFDTDHDCIVNVYDVEWEPVAGTKGEVRIPKGGIQLDIRFHEQLRAQKWPQVISGDAGNYPIKLFSLDLASKIEDQGFTGIEFFPLVMRMGELRGLKGKEDSCPGYVWARVSGIILVDLYLGDNPATLDAGGRYALTPCPIGDIWKMKARSEQPEAADFSRVVPAGRGGTYVTPRVAGFFDDLKLKEVRISAFGNGWL